MREPRTPGHLSSFLPPRWLSYLWSQRSLSHVQFAYHWIGRQFGIHSFRITGLKACTGIFHPWNSLTHWTSGPFSLDCSVMPTLSCNLEDQESIQQTSSTLIFLLLHFYHGTNFRQLYFCLLEIQTKLLAIGAAPSYAPLSLARPQCLPLF